MLEGVSSLRRSNKVQRPLSSRKTNFESDIWHSNNFFTRKRTRVTSSVYLHVSSKRTKKKWKPAPLSLESARSGLRSHAATESAFTSHSFVLLTWSCDGGRTAIERRRASMRLISSEPSTCDVLRTVIKPRRAFDT